MGCLLTSAWYSHATDECLAPLVAATRLVWSTDRLATIDSSCGTVHLMPAQPKSVRAPLELTVRQVCSAVRAAAALELSPTVYIQRCWWTLAQAAFCVAGCALILMDVHVGGVLGSTSNGKFVSFMDSVNSLSDYRKQQPFDPPLPGDAVQCCTSEQPAHNRKSRYSLTDGHSIGMQLYILLAACGSKYGSSTVASLLLQQTPVIMKGPRHMLSFLVRCRRILRACSTQLPMTDG